MNRTLAFCGTGVLTFVVTCSAVADNWPTWRGPEMNGVSAEKNLPLKWSDKENVRWRADLPGPGNSSPIVWGDRVFVSQAVSTENRRTLLCFDRASGKLLWQSGVTYEENEPTQQSNPYCSGSPVTDGERIFVCFGSAGASAYGFDGKEVWHRDLGKLNHVFGNAVSVILHGELCILNFGPDEKARLIALDKTTGQTVWEATPPKPDENEVQQEMRSAFAGAGGSGGPGGRRGFGPGMFLAGPIIAQADKNGDGKVSIEEFTALADVWFDKLDAGKAGKLSQEQFTDGLNDILPAPQGFGPPGGGPPAGGQPPDGGRGFGPARFMGPGLFTAADTDKDGSLTRGEWKGSSEKWFATWDADKTGSLNEELVRDGLNATLPRPTFGGPGPGGVGGRGPGGPGGPGGIGGIGGRAPRGPGGPGGFGGPGGGGMGGSWSTPIVVQTDGRDELIVNFAFRLVAFEPMTGKPLWTSKGVGGSIYTTPLVGDGAVVAMSSGVGGGSAIAVKLGGSGEVTEYQPIWRLERVKSCIGSGVIHDGHVYTIAQDGIAACLDLNTGKTVWEQRLTARSGRNSSWSSMLLADGKIYVPNQSGDVFVLRAGPKFELLATNAVGEATNASLAASNGKLFLRTDKSLWCLADVTQ